MKQIVLFFMLTYMCILHIYAADYYWIGSTTDNNWSSIQNCSSSSGGTSDVALLPANSDNVIFDANSFQPVAARRAVVINAAAYCKNITFTNIPSNRLPTLTVNNMLNVSGSVRLMPGMAVNGNGSTISLGSTQVSETLTLSDVTFNNVHLSIGGIAAWTVGGNVRCSNFTYNNPNGLTVPGLLTAGEIAFSGGGSLIVDGQLKASSKLGFFSDGNLSVGACPQEKPLPLLRQGLPAATV